MKAVRLFLLLPTLLLFFGKPVQAGLKQSLFAIDQAKVQAMDTTGTSVGATWKPAHHGSNDPWLGQDKANHLLVSVMLSSMSYLGLTAFNNDRDPSLIGAIGGTLVIGAGKEIWDMIHPGQPSWKDLTADAAGALIGGFAARAIQ